MLLVLHVMHRWLPGWLSWHSQASLTTLLGHLLQASRTSRLNSSLLLPRYKYWQLENNLSKYSSISPESCEKILLIAGDSFSSTASLRWEHHRSTSEFFLPGESTKPSVNFMAGRGRFSHAMLPLDPNLAASASNPGQKVNRGRCGTRVSYLQVLEDIKNGAVPRWNRHHPGAHYMVSRTLRLLGACCL